MENLKGTFIKLNISITVCKINNLQWENFKDQVSAENLVKTTVLQEYIETHMFFRKKKTNLIFKQKYNSNITRYRKNNWVRNSKNKFGYV